MINCQLGFIVSRLLVPLQVLLLLQPITLMGAGVSYKRDNNRLNS
jgi:hypothetical protein